MQEINKQENKLPHQEIDYFKIGRIIISRWYWIAASVAICYFIAHVYLWYTPKTYATSSTLKLEDKKPELTDISGTVSTPERGFSRVQSESFVIQSRQVILNAIKDIDYRISFFLEGRVRTSELYPHKPLDIELLKFDTLNFYHDLIKFKGINARQYSLSYKEGIKEITKNCTYNTPVNVGPTAFSIRSSVIPGDKAIYLFKFNNPDDFVGRVQGGLHTSEVMKNSNIISLQETDSNPQFAADILNAIMLEYLNFDRNQKTRSATQMISFIDNQLDYLSGEVNSSAKSLINFQRKNKILDVNTSATNAMSKAKDLEGQRSELNLQLIAIDQLKQQVMHDKENVSLNLNMAGTLDPLISSLVGNLNGLIAQRRTLLKTYNANSEPISDINQQILQIKNAVLNNLDANKGRMLSNKRYLETQLNQANQQISALPSAQRDLVVINRGNDINEKVYSFLSEKKLGAQISRSAILPGATIVEQAQANFGPISPNEHDIYRSAIIFGLAIGFGIIVLIRILNPYIYDKETIESLTTVPIIGVIRKFPHAVDEDNTQVLALSEPKSVFAESIRSVRTNLNFLASEKQSKIICITSEVAGEGKSFVAVNLSSTISLIDKKVILIAADLRRSKLHRTFKTPNDKGLSTYLSNQHTLDEVLYKAENNYFDFIPSGPVPPNPSELLHNDRMKSLLDELKQTYDIIMIDTAPIGLVSDSIPLIRLSDINVFVIRSGKSKYYAATIPQRVAAEYHLNNTVIILNAYEEDLLHSRYYTTKFTGENYGSRYYYYSDYSGYSGSGYYVDEPKSRWWDIRRWFK
ncbi:tyrosine-protein kinase domain-containing protein [Mucilaginibacter koreensis]